MLLISRVLFELLSFNFCSRIMFLAICDAKHDAGNFFDIQKFGLVILIEKYVVSQDRNDFFVKIY